jgi:hypothetical protein
MNDPWLLSYLLEVTIERIKTEGTPAGFALENFVFVGLQKQASWSTTKPETFYGPHGFWTKLDLVSSDRSGCSPRMLR